MSASHHDNLPSFWNGWNWGGPSPATHRYRQVIRDAPIGYGFKGTTWCYQTDDNFHASSAAYIFVSNAVPSGYQDPDDPEVFVHTGYDMEDAEHWFSEACALGIVFG